MMRITITVRTDDGEISLTETDGKVIIEGSGDYSLLNSKNKLLEALDKIKEAIK